MECRGDHAAMGRQQGEQARGIVQHSLRVLGTAEAFRLHKPALVPMSLFLWLARRKATALVKPDVARHYPNQARRIEGIAEGSGVDERFLYLGLSAELLMAKVEYCLGCCSAVGLVPPAGTEPMIVKNFDYPQIFAPLAVSRLNRPDKAYASLDVSVGPFAGNHDGINEHGFTVCYNYGYGVGTNAAAAPITLLCQELLERCRTTAEAVELLQTLPWAGGAMLMLGDADGDVRAVELAPGRMAVREAAEGVVINTNHYLTTELAPHDTPHDAYYTHAAVKALRGQRVHESSERRLARLADRLLGARGWTRERLEELARDHGGLDAGNNHTPCRHSDYFTTTCSVLFLPRQRKMYLVDGPPCAGEYREFGFEPAGAKVLAPTV